MISTMLATPVAPRWCPLESRTPLAFTGLRACQGSDLRAEAATQTGFVVYCFAFSADMRTSAAAPSPVGQHMYSVLGQAIILAFITSSRETSTWDCGYGLFTECLWFFSHIFAKCSIFVPYLRMCSTPAWPNTPGMRPVPITPSVL